MDFFINILQGSLLNHQDLAWNVSGRFFLIVASIRVSFGIPHLEVGDPHLYTTSEKNGLVMAMAQLLGCFLLEVSIKGYDQWVITYNPKDIPFISIYK